MTTPCGCKVEFVADPPQGHEGYDGNGDFQPIYCPKHASVDQLVEAAKMAVTVLSSGGDHFMPNTLKKLQAALTAAERTA